MRGALGPALLAAGLSAAAAGVGAPADVLIVQRPSALVLFDTYQQRLDSARAASFPPFVPIVLLRLHDVMGDGFTPCAAVAIDGAPFYLQEESSGAFATSAPCGYTAVFRGVTMREDTVILLSGGALRLRSPSSGESSVVAPGTRALRVFETKRETYVRVPSAGMFGWVVLSPGGRPAAWRIQPAAPRAEVSADDVLRRVRGVTESANRTLRRLYDALGAGKGTIPSFRAVRSGREISCAVVPSSLTGEFTGSLLAMLPALERALGGTGLHPEIGGGAIHILLP